MLTSSTCLGHRIHVQRMYPEEGKVLSRHARPPLMSSYRPKDGVQAHKATRMMRALDLEDGEADGWGLQPCQLGAELYELALVTLMRVQGMCHSSSSLSKWALELLHDQGWKVGPALLACRGCAGPARQYVLRLFVACTAAPAEQLSSCRRGCSPYRVVHLQLSDAPDSAACPVTSRPGCVPDCAALRDAC